MEVLINEQIREKEWKEFLLGNRYATPFQSPGFYKLFNSVSGLSAEAIAIEDSGALRALAVIAFQQETGLIKGFLSRRGIIYGGPLTDDSCPSALDMLIRQIALRFTRKSIYIETRNFSDYRIYRKTFHENGFRYIPYLNFKVNTGDPEIMASAVSKGRMRQIRKAQKNSVFWTEAANRDEVHIFYNILKHLYRYKIGKPLFHAEFFNNFFDLALGKYLLVRYKENIIGGIMCPILEGRAIYEFYICGLDTEYKEQYPSVMATWAAMEYACEQNLPLFDFMGAGKPDNSYGVREFKARFGGTLVEEGRFLLINKPLLYNAGRAGLRLLKPGNEDSY